MKKEKRKIGNIPIPQLEKEVNDFINEIRENEPALTGSFEVVEHQDYSEATVDEDRKILSYRKKDGTKVENVGIETPILKSKEVETKNIEVEDGGDFEGFNDVEERVSIEEDPTGKVLSYRKKDGTKVECAGVETPNISAKQLNLSPEGISKFQEDVVKAGFAGNNWSYYISEDGDKPLQLPEPRCALVNIISENGLPLWKNLNYRGYIEYSDMMGNYFKKPVVLNAQGSSSIHYNHQKNIAVDLFDSEWDGDAFKIKIGNWVPQDSFHIKSFYMDPIRGLADVCYKYAEEVIKATNTRQTRLAIDADKTTINGDTGTVKFDYDGGALCHPDGFPCLVYLNGEFMGIYAWNLKKHRDNYLMDKKDYESVHIDPDVMRFSGAINWTTFEIRNPKSLYCMDGTEYDGDAPKELIDSSSEYYDSSNKKHKSTVKTKNLIEDFYTIVPALLQLLTISTSNGDIVVNAFAGNYDAGVNFGKGRWVEDSDNYYMSIHSTNVGHALSDTDYWIDITQNIIDAKALFDTKYDVESFIIFWIVSQVIDNWDGLYGKNTQWLYYDKSKKWVPAFYDLDNCIGYHGSPWLYEPRNLLLEGTDKPYDWVWRLYTEDVIEKYHELRQSQLISTETFMRHYNDWCSRLDPSYIELNAQMWDVPCYRDGKINSEYWKQVNLLLGNTEITYDPEASYEVGNRVTYGLGNYISGPYVIQFECVKACVGEEPCGSYPNKPQTGGVFDSPRRVKMWFDRKLTLLDNLIKY